VSRKTTKVSGSLYDPEEDPGTVQIKDTNSGLTRELVGVFLTSAWSAVGRSSIVTGDHLSRHSDQDVGSANHADVDERIVVRLQPQRGVTDPEALRTRRSQDHLGQIDVEQCLSRNHGGSEAEDRSVAIPEAQERLRIGTSQGHARVARDR